MNAKHKLHKIFENDKTPFVVLSLVAFAIGVTLTLSVNTIRYTNLLPPYIQDISSAEVYKNISQNSDKYIFIDVRSEQEFMQAHASGSVNLPIHYLYDDTHGKRNAKGIDLPKDKEIYLTCTGGRLAGVAYSYLEHYGYTNIKRVENGLAGWRMSGLPIITNMNPSKNIAPLDLPFETDENK